MLDGFGGEINETARRIAEKSKQGNQITSEVNGNNLSREMQKKADLFEDTKLPKRGEGRERMTKRLGKAATFVTNVLLFGASLGMGGNAVANEIKNDNSGYDNVVTSGQTKDSNGSHDLKIEATQVAKQAEISNNKIIPESITDLEAVLKTVPDGLKENGKASIPLIIQAFKNEGITSPEVIGNALGAAEAEADIDLASTEKEADTQSKKHNYDGGSKYAAHGIGLTHKYNYEKYDKYLKERFPGREYEGLKKQNKKLDLVNDPDQAAIPEIAAAIFAAFYKNERNENGLNMVDLILQGRNIEARKIFQGKFDETDPENEQLTRIMKYINMRAKSYSDALRIDISKASSNRN